MEFRNRCSCHFAVFAEFDQGVKGSSFLGVPVLRKMDFRAAEAHGAAIGQGDDEHAPVVNALFASKK